MNIEYPTREEIEVQIAQITARGLRKRHSLFYYISDIYRNAGLRMIFHGVTDVVFIALMAAAGIAAGFIASVFSGIYSDPQFHAALFTASPVVYILLCLLSFWKETLSGTYDLKMSCKYTVYHLSALRMLVFSCLSIIFNLCVVGVLCFLFQGLNFWKLFFISAASLFLFSVLLLFGLLNRDGRASTLIISGLWIAGSLTAFACFGHAYEEFLQTMPLMVHIFVAAILIVCYGAEMARLLFRQKEGSLC